MELDGEDKNSIDDDASLKRDHGAVAYHATSSHLESMSCNDLVQALGSHFENCLSTLTAPLDPNRTCASALEPLPHQGNYNMLALWHESSSNNEMEQILTPTPTTF